MIEKKLKIPKKAIKRIDELLKEGQRIRATNWYMCFQDAGYDVEPLRKIFDKYGYIDK